MPEDLTNETKIGNYRIFHKIFEAFKISEVEEAEEAKKDDSKEKEQKEKSEKEKEPKEEDDDDDDDDDKDEEVALFLNEVLENVWKIWLTYKLIYLGFLASW